MIETNYLFVVSIRASSREEASQKFDALKGKDPRFALLDAVEIDPTHAPAAPEESHAQ